MQRDTSLPPVGAIAYPTKPADCNRVIRNLLDEFILVIVDSRQGLVHPTQGLIREHLEDLHLFVHVVAAAFKRRVHPAQYRSDANSLDQKERGSGRALPDCQYGRRNAHRVFTLKPTIRLPKLTGPSRSRQSR